MKTIINTHLVSGGTVGPALAACAGVIAGGAAAVEGIKSFIELGKDLGEAIYNKNHKDDNPLGKMHYEKKDYTQNYLDYKHPPAYGHSHPNNMNANNFHGSFGNF